MTNLSGNSVGFKDNTIRQFRSFDKDIERELPVCPELIDLPGRGSGKKIDEARTSGNVANFRPIHSVNASSFLIEVRDESCVLEMV